MSYLNVGFQEQKRIDRQYGLEEIKEEKTCPSNIDGVPLFESAEENNTRMATRMQE